MCIERFAASMLEGVSFVEGAIFNCIRDGECLDATP
jgi:hypothetical protein